MLLSNVEIFFLPLSSFPISGGELVETDFRPKVTERIESETKP